MHEFDIDEPVEEMDEGDLRSTLDEFMDKHEDNVADYRELESDRDEISEKVEQLETDVSAYAETEATLAEKFAEVVAAESPMFDAEEVADRFSLGELLAKADAMGAFSLETETPEEDPDAEEEPTFDEKPDKAPTGSGGSGGSFSATAEEDLNEVLGL
jgi:peptidoglycan hydrolase CwlO-like protein